MINIPIILFLRIIIAASVRSSAQLQLEHERAVVVDLKLQVHKNKGLHEQATLTAA
jgi:hypothetical protein